MTKFTNNTILSNNFTKYYILSALFIFLLSYIFETTILHDLNYLTLGPNEASHLNVARSVFNGNLPYIEHFDARGPLTFYILSICFFFKNFLLSFHLLFFFTTLISSFVCYKICENLYNKQAALFALLISGFILSQSLTPENFAFLFLSSFIYFSICKIDNNKIIYPMLSGLFMSFAVLIRFNISFVAIFGCLFYLLQNKNRIRNLFAYAISGFLPLIIILYIYSRHENGLNIFFNATLFYHLSLTGGRPFYIGIYQLLEILSTLPWISLFIMSIFSFLFYKKLKKEKFFLLVFFIASIFATSLARKYNLHYLLVSAPFLIVLSSSLIDIKILKSKKLITFVFLISVIPLLINNLYLKVENFYKPKNFSYFMSKLLSSHIKKGDEIFSSLNGIYLYMNKKNYLRLVDMSHFDRPYNYRSVYGDSTSFIDEFKNVLSVKPKFLIFDDFFKKSSIYQTAQELIKDNYQIYDFYDKNEINKYRRSYRDLLNTTSVYILKKNKD